MQRTLLAVLIGIGVLSSPLKAQSRAVTGGSTAQVEENVFRTLFSGISLTDEQREEARRIIAEEMRKQLALDRSDPDVFDKRIRLNATRDSTLRLLLKEPDDIARFDRQSASIRPRPARRP